MDHLAKAKKSVKRMTCPRPRKTVAEGMQSAMRDNEATPSRLASDGKLASNPSNGRTEENRGMPLNPPDKDKQSGTGGSFQVQIGDSFCDGRYNVIGALGSGLYSTVWLVDDKRHKQCAALKILNSDFHNGRFELFELEIMQKLRQVSALSKHPGKDHVAQLLDHFEVSGPSGKHVCMVLRLLGASIGDQSIRLQVRRLPYRVVRQITRQLLQALDFLHKECGVIHTDIHPSNICIELPDVATAVRSAKTGQSGQVELPTPSVMTTGEELKFCLSDFGISSWMDKHLTDNVVPPLLRAPELTLKAPWDEKVDVFNLGALMLQFATGELPFPGKEGRNSGWSAEGDRLSQLLQQFGGEPEVVLKNADRADEFDKEGVELRRPTPSGPNAWFTGFVQDRAGGPGASDDIPETETRGFVDLVQCMLATDPSRRWSAGELLQHGWVAE